MSNATQPRRRRTHQGITHIAIKGYKSLIERCEIGIRPLTLLAGANSSGKSSIMQPLLMLKQTLDATYDPGALLLNGPNVRYTSADQLFSRSTNPPNPQTCTISVTLNENESFEITFQKRPKKGIDIASVTYTSQHGTSRIIRPTMAQEEIQSIIPASIQNFEKLFAQEAIGFELFAQEEIRFEWKIERLRCFLVAQLTHVGRARNSSTLTPFALTTYPNIDEYNTHIRNIIHVPGLRGNPERTYKTTAIGETFPGTFENYVASIIHNWQTTKDERLKRLGTALETLGLTWKVEAKQIDDTQVELRVGRTPHGKRGGAKDTVNITDVGFGVSQTLPVLVALLTAKPDQLVYIEQPEIHLHPRAQSAMASVLADAAQRGVRVVIETHSSLLLRGIQTLVANNSLPHDRIHLHWFTRNPENGATEITSAHLDDEGAFGDWPEDFDDVILGAEQAYLDAVEQKAAHHE